MHTSNHRLTAPVCRVDQRRRYARWKLFVKWQQIGCTPVKCAATRALMQLSASRHILFIPLTASLGEGKDGKSSPWFDVQGDVSVRKREERIIVLQNSKQLGWSALRNIINQAGSRVRRATMGTPSCDPWNLRSRMIDLSSRHGQSTSDAIGDGALRRAGWPRFSRSKTLILIR